MTAHVPVNLPGREYDILIGPGVIDQAGTRIAAMTKRKHIAIVTDATVAGLHLAILQAVLTDAGLTSDALILPAGEATKSWEQLQHTTLCRGHHAARRAVCADPDDTAGAGRQLCRWQDGDQLAPWQEPCGGVSPAKPCAGGYGPAGYPQHARFSGRIRRGREIRAAGGCGFLCVALQPAWRRAIWTRGCAR